MVNKRNGLSLIALLWSLKFIAHNAEDTPADDFEFNFDLDNVCVSEFHIEKYTLASSDSYRDNEFTMLIFPEADAEYAPHFIQDLCARQSKCTLPFSCFKIHAPQTDQHEEGYLSVKALENEFSKKFFAVIQGYSAYKFDAFFDYSMGFWVDTLDKYLQRINDNAGLLTNYIGLKWESPSPVDRTFWSLIILSPASQKVYELMSLTAPDLSKYPNLRSSFEFMASNEIRASFLSYTTASPPSVLPWERDDGADIVPVQISFGCSDLNEQVEFYTHVLEAQTLLFESGLVSSLDGHTVRYAFLKPVLDVLEIKFVQRPVEYTYGAFTTEVYKNLLTATHNDRITSPTCGLDRWYDNHYGYNTLKFASDPANYDYMDRVLQKVIARGQKYRLYHTPYADESPEGKYWMSQFGFDDMKTLYVFDVNGQTIQMLGVFAHSPMNGMLPIYHKQWCEVPCPMDEEQGSIDSAKIYQEDEDDVVYQAVMQQNQKYDRRSVLLEEMQAAIDALLLQQTQPQETFSDIDSVGGKRFYELHTRDKYDDDHIQAVLVDIAYIVIGVVLCFLGSLCVYRCMVNPSYVLKREATVFDTAAYDSELQALLAQNK